MLHLLPRRAVAPCSPHACIGGALALLLATTASVAQCVPTWQQGEGIAGVAGEVDAVVAWDPDGPGPLSVRVVVAGTFSHAGNVAANNIAVFDPVTATWSALGSGLGSPARALAVAANGDLFVGGDFTTAGGSPANRVARWNGVSWSALGAGTSGPVHALAVEANGSVVVGGAFFSAGSVSVANIARWNGASWSALGAGATTSLVKAIAVLPSGDLAAVGGFQTAFGSGADRVSQWNGSSWISLSNEEVGLAALHVRTNGELVVGGSFASIGVVAANRVASWNGSTWQAVGAGPASTVRRFANLANGDLVAFCSDGIAVWNGSTWATPAPAVPGTRTGMVTANGDVYVAGSFEQVGATVAQSIARWNGSAWLALGVGWGSTSPEVRALLALPNGDVVAGGFFVRTGGRNIARFDGTAWSPLGSGIDGSVLALARLPSGDIVAGGQFTTAGGVATANIARWDGVAWHPLGSGVQGSVYALAVLPGGDLVAGGFFSTAGGVAAANIARWDGVAWHPLGGGTNSVVWALASLGNGQLAVGGSFSSPGDRVAIWDGATWTPRNAPPICNRVNAMLVSRAGELVIGGDFFNSPHSVSRWNGTAWVAVGTGMTTSGGFSGVVQSLLELPNGDLLAGGLFGFAGGVPAAGIARWNGAAWAAVDGGLDTGANALARSADDEVFAGGSFRRTGSKVTFAVGRLATNCVASVANLGAGCTSSGGPLALSPSSLPWTGSTFRTVGTGMPASALVVSVASFTTFSVPLSLLVVEGQPGCDLLMGLDVVSLSVPIAGSNAWSLPIANTAALAGIVVHHQMLVAELDVSSAIVAITSTNGLSMTIGTF